MTNSELLAYSGPANLLTSIESQRRFLLVTESVKQPCPNCATEQNIFEAGSIDIDSYDFGTTKHTYNCIGCGRGLTYSVPFVSVSGPGWRWSLVPEPVKENV